MTEAWVRRLRVNNSFFIIRLLTPQSITLGTFFIFLPSSYFRHLIFFLWVPSATIQLTVFKVFHVQVYFSYFLPRDYRSLSSLRPPPPPIVDIQLVCSYSPTPRKDIERNLASMSISFVLRAISRTVERLALLSAHAPGPWAGSHPELWEK